MYISWVIIAWSDPELEDRITHSDFFKVKPNPGFLKPVGIPFARSYRPWLVEPRIEVWQEIIRKINRETEGAASNRSSRIFLSDTEHSDPRSYVFNVRFYRPGTICIEVKVDIDIGCEEVRIFEYRNLNNHKCARFVVDCLIGIVKHGDIKGYPQNNSFSSKPAMLISAPTTDDDFVSWKDNNKAYITGVLINNKNFKDASPELAEKIFQRNKELDIKYAKKSISLISKQGSLTVYSKSGTDLMSDLEREHTRRFRFLEYACAIQTFIGHYAEIRLNNRERADFLLHLCMPFMSEKTNFPKTVTGSNTWRILAQEFNLEKSFEVLERNYITELSEKEKYYIDIPQKEYDSLEYMTHVLKATRKHRSWVIKDFGGSKLIQWVVGTMIALIIPTIAIITYLKK